MDLGACAQSLAQKGRTLHLSAVSFEHDHQAPGEASRHRAGGQRRASAVSNTGHPLR